MKLNEVAQVNIGVLLNREIDNTKGNTYKLFNIKNYDLKEEYEEVKTSKNLDNKLTKKGDLLFRLVYPNRIVYIEKDMEDLLVPSQMCIIRPDKKKIEPQFLKWYLESDLGKSEILPNVTGSSIQKISVLSLKNIGIPIINMKKQKGIRDLIELWTREKEILKETIENKEKLYNNLISEIVEKEV